MMLPDRVVDALLCFPAPLREEMDSLQRQMEEHTVTVHESMSSWPNAEEDLAQLGLPDDVSSSHGNAEGNNVDAEQQQQF